MHGAIPWRRPWCFFRVEARRATPGATPRAAWARGAGHMVAGDRNDAITEAVVDFLNEAFEVSP